MEYPVFPLRTILHPTDFSERSAQAFQVACALARDADARVVALHVFPPVVFNFGAGPSVTTLEQERDRLWDQLLRLQPLYPGVGVEHRLEEGGPAEEILRVAAALPCDLIVMGTHGRTGLGRVLMGSVAEDVLRRAPCPVVTVRAPSPTTPRPAEPAQAPADVVL
jgi:nucleotide-binding universal stress UspA family protein